MPDPDPTTEEPVVTLEDLEQAADLLLADQRQSKSHTSASVIDAATSGKR